MIAPIPLDECAFAPKGMSREHVDKWKATPPHQWPDIKVIRFGSWFAVLNGRHRVTAARELNHTHIWGETTH